MESYLIVQHDNFLKLLKFKEHEKSVNVNSNNKSNYAFNFGLHLYL